MPDAAPNPLAAEIMRLIDRAAVARLSAELVRLEAEERAISMQLLAHVEPLATSLEACDALIEMLPPGFVCYRVRIIREGFLPDGADGTGGPD